MIKAGLMERKRHRGLRTYHFERLNNILARNLEASIAIKREESLDA
jgi:hypothetical protein